jgi:ABC-type glycerol-3-phosphate transport system substrate-binding protein
MSKLIKKLSVVFLIALLLGASTSCSQQTKIENDDEAKLTINLLDSDKTLLDAVNKYNRESQNIKIDAKIFTDIEEFKNKNTTELLSGQGSDIIVNRLDLLSNIYRISSNSVFCDLNEIIAKDTSFKLSDYYENILDYGIINDKRYFMPINYLNCGFYTSQEVLSKNNIKLDGVEWTWKNFASIIKKFIVENKSKNKYFIDSLNFTQILSSINNPFLDYETKKTSFNSIEFIELLNLYKDIYPAICPTNIRSKYNYIDLLKNDIVIFQHTSQVDSPNFLSIINNSQVINQPIKIFRIPTLKVNDPIIVWPYYLLSINENCKNKMDAFKYIKILLTYEFQQTTNNHDYNRLTPIRKSAYALDMDYYLTEKDPLQKPLAEQINKIRSSIGVGKLFENEVYQIIEAELPEFIKGSRTAEQTAKIIDGRVSIYINE